MKLRKHVSLITWRTNAKICSREAVTPVYTGCTCTYRLVNETDIIIFILIRLAIFVESLKQFY